MNNRRFLCLLTLLLWILLCTAALTACQSQDREALHLPTQLEQLQAIVPPADTEQSGAITTMRRDSTALTIEALEDGLSYRLTPELFGMTPSNICITLQGLDQNGSYIAFPEEPEINFNGEPSAVLTLDDSSEKLEALRYLSLQTLFMALECDTVLEIPLDGSERTYELDGYLVQLQSVERKQDGYTIQLTPIAAADGTTLFFLDITDCLEEDANVFFTQMNNHTMQIHLTSTRSSDELVHLSVSHYTLSSGYWFYEIKSAS